MAEVYYDEAATQMQEQVACTDDMVRQRDHVRHLLALRPGEHVLDVGSGNGILAREMLADVGERGQVVGVEPAEAMLVMSSRLCPGASFLAGDASELPVDDAQFDAVTGSQVLCFVPDVERALAEMHRVLRPGGRLVLLDTDWDSLVWNCRDQALLARVVVELHRPYTSANVPRRLSAQLEAAGFAVTERVAHPVVNWERDEASYSWQMACFLPRSTTPGETALGDEWAAEMAAMATAGEYFFSLNRYIVCATR